MKTAGFRLLEKLLRLLFLLKIRALARTKKKSPSQTPLMKQYNAIKAKHPDAILLFRVGDFYETFGEDAVKAAKVLGIVLTKRKNGAAATIDLAGFPHHSLDSYLPKLVRAGYRVAICDQLEDPKVAKKIVKRGITELVTPGVSYNENVIEHNKNNFLCSIFFEKKEMGVAFLDITTGEFLTSQGNVEFISKLVASFQPSEILFQRSKASQYTEVFGDQFPTYGLEDWIYTLDFGTETLLKHFETSSLKGFGIENLPFGIIASGACLHYLGETRHEKVRHINKIARVEREEFVWLDHFTIRNLELFNALSPSGKTLLEVIDHTITSMGSRLLKRWLALPLKNKKEIEQRLAVVDYFLQEEEVKATVEEHLRDIGDLERLISKVSANRINPKELLQLKKGLKASNPIKEICENASINSLQDIGDQLNPCKNVIEKIEKGLQEDAPVLVSKGGVIKEGVSKELDEYRDLAYSGKDYLVQLQQREMEKTGIPSLKVSFNNVFGYYLEVRNTHKDKVPEEWIRKQTLVNAERYITPELKEYESKILSAEEKIGVLEAQLYEDLVREVSQFLEPIQLTAKLIAKIDCLVGFTSASLKNNYTKPDVNEEKTLSIFQGRHPVIEQELPIGESYVPNDTYLDDKTQQIIMITGPNMSGKSAILRQTALIVLMAQMGCFVPAKRAEIGIIDKLFTRVGASDNISQGESTFMVEMNETASILNNLSDRSLILLDEIGRGTSTYDGISIAWAIAEYLHKAKEKPKTLFATHYHELNEMATSFERIKNFNVSVKEIKNKIIFLRKLVPGGSEHSFGIHVAKMAGMPSRLIVNANKILKELESSNLKEANKSSLRRKQEDDFQLSFFQLDDPTLSHIKDEILNTDIDTLTPVEALLKLNEIKNLLKS